MAHVQPVLLPRLLPLLLLLSLCLHPPQTFCSRSVPRTLEFFHHQERLLLGFSTSVEGRLSRVKQNPGNWSCSCVYHRCGDFFNGPGECHDSKAPVHKSFCPRSRVDCSPRVFFPTSSFVQTPPNLKLYELGGNIEGHDGITNDACILGGLEDEGVYQAAREGKVVDGGAFIGTIHGTFLQWPGRPRDKEISRLESRCTPYDPRQRPWFLPSISPRKVMIIIRDVTVRSSTSTTVDYLMKTLGFGDLVGIVPFDDRNSTSSGSKSVPEEPYQLRDSNLYWEVLRQADAREPVAIKRAFKSAFELIKDASVGDMDKVIIFIHGSPVVEDVADEILESVQGWQSQDDFANILTYSVPPRRGLGAFDNDFALRLACENRGVWTKVDVPDLPDMSSYMSLMSLAAEFSSEKESHIHFTSVYDDAGGSGDVITLSRGFYDECEAAQGGPKRILRGVVGLDVKVVDLKDQGLDQFYNENLKASPLHLSIKNVENIECQLEWIRSQGSGECPGKKMKCGSNNRCRRQVVNLKRSNATYCNLALEPGKGDVDASLCCKASDADEKCRKSSASQTALTIAVVCVAAALVVVLVAGMWLCWRTRGPSSLKHQPCEVKKGRLKASISADVDGRVKRGIFHGRDVNIKVFPANRREEFEKEVAILNKMPVHENIVRLLAAGDTSDEGDGDGERYLILELMDMDLEQYLMNDRIRKNLTYKSLLQIFLDIATGLEHIHKNKVVHRDVKPANLLVKIRGNKCTVKLSDFKQGKQYYREEVLHLSGVRGTVGYMSPELMQRAYSNHDTRVTPATDIYSLGVVMCECIVGEDAFEENLWDMPEGITELVAACRQYDEVLRPKASEVCSKLRKLIKSPWVSHLAFMPYYRDNVVLD